MGVTLLNILSPVEYINLYYFLMLPVVLSFLFIDRDLNSGLFRLFIVALGTIFFMGLRPLSWYFTDMHNYASYFEASKENLFIEGVSDAGFNIYMFLAAKWLSTECWFFLTALLYVFGYVFLYFTLYRNKGGYLLALLYLCFFFFSYGTNTIRAGLASSIVMVALALFLKNRFFLSAVMAVIAITFHSSMALLVVAALVAILFKRMLLYYYFWILCFILSLVFGNSIALKFSSLLDFDDRFVNYMTQTQNIGGVFRWDFFLFGALPVLWSAYLWIYERYRDNIYWWFVRIYLIANGFWILAIRAAFSDRFAYMAWTLIPVLLLYPLLDIRCSYIHKLSTYKFFIIITFGLTLYLYFK